MTWSIQQGDVLDRLREMPDESVQCCVTSPPYWGLRRYIEDGAPEKPFEIGLEATPDEHVAKLVEVFREVRRVLRSDGVCWINYGSFYADGRLAGRRDAGRGTSRTGRQDSSAGDPAYSRSGGESGASGSLRTSRTLQLPHESERRLENGDRRRDASGSVTAETRISPCGDPESTTPQSSPPPQDGCSRSESIASSQSSPLTSLLDALESACKDARRGKCDTSSIALLLADHIEDKEPSLLAWLYSTIALRGFKQKDLVNMPAILAEALRLDGWFVRSDVIWSKAAPMPESVTDRPTRSHEFVFLLSKSARYFYDAEAIREAADPANHRPSAGIRTTPPGSSQHGGPANGVRSYSHRNARTVWTINPQPTPEAHFATFPEALAERCILAGTSAHGACSKCGAPWERVTGPAQRVEGRASGNTERKIGSDHIPGASHVGRGVPWHPTTKPTVGWRLTCDCPSHLAAPPRPCLVLDPFAGSGTTLLVAERLGRDSIGIELNPEYIAIAERRIKAHDPTATIELAPGVKQASLFTGDMP